MLGERIKNLVISSIISNNHLYSTLYYFRCVGFGIKFTLAVLIEVTALFLTVIF